MAEERTPICDLGSGLYFPNSSDKWVKVSNDRISYGGPVTITTSGANLTTPATTADDLVLNVGSDGGITILCSTTGRVAFGKAGDNDVGLINYTISGDIMSLSVGGNGRYFFAPECFSIRETSDTTPTIHSSSSGALFVSGGALWYKGFEDTYTRLAVA